MKYYGKIEYECMKTKTIKYQAHAVFPNAL